MTMPSLSFVFPCLNEETTIGLCIQELRDVMDKTGISYEIIVSDNGSTDESIRIAESLGARVVHALKKGYGEALKKGFEEAKAPYVAFADCDGSYPLTYLPDMYKTIVDEDADMVVASRTKGIIEKGAMPFLHRYLGTPVLTKLIDILFRGKLSDCNSGFRIFKKETYESWHVTSSGMEFASELLIKALKQKAKIIEIPAGLRPDKRQSPPHLRTWRDGMRHLLFILSEAPHLFEYVGFFLVGLATALEIVSVVLGPIQIGRAMLFDYHSKLIFLCGMILGLQVWIFAASLYLFKKTDKPTRLTAYLIRLKEENLFLANVLIIFFALICFVAFLIVWGINDFHNMNYIRPLIDISYALIFAFLSSLGLMQIHILKRVAGQEK